MKHEEITHEIIGCAYKVFNELVSRLINSVPNNGKIKI